MRPALRASSACLGRVARLCRRSLVTIGAHTITHCNLAKQSETIASFELATSRARIEDALQRPALHLAYPYGDRSPPDRANSRSRAIGFRTAVTTRPGMLYPESADHLTALQRVSLNGHYQDARLLPVLTSGAATRCGMVFAASTRRDALALSPPPTSSLTRSPAALRTTDNATEKRMFRSVLTQGPRRAGDRGSRGIGKMIAAGFLAQGAAKVYITARKAGPCEATARSFRAYDGECIALRSISRRRGLR